MDITTRSVPAARVPLRQLAILGLLVALVAAALAAYVGSQRHIPAPFGPARNGLIAYAADGDIFTTDPLTGQTHSIVTGPEVDRRPMFSRDGTHLAFFRSTDPTAAAFALVVTKADGSDPRLVSDAAFSNDDYFEWAPDGSYIMVSAASGTLTRYDASGSAAPVGVADHVRFVPGSFRPPDGKEMLVQPDDPTGLTLTVLNADGTGSRPILHIALGDSTPNDLQEFHWSPDGTRIVFARAPKGDQGQLRGFVMHADGTDVRQLAIEPSGAWFEVDMNWSPDSSKIAFNRWRQNPAGSWDIKPIGIVSADGGSVMDAGPTPVSDGAAFDWSPDGKSIVSIPGTVLQYPVSPMKSGKPTLIDPVDGSARQADWLVGSAATWQRLAP
jgi:Tol biopolymer transport system component